jgi:putative transcriptional regulator
MIDTMTTAAAAPTRHPPSELLIDFATGGASPAESLIIGAHIARCADCRRSLDILEAVGGLLLNTLQPAWLPPAAMNRMLQWIDRSAAGDTGPEAATAYPAWRRIPGGYGMLRIPCDDASWRVWILKAPAGKGLLRHRHVGEEWTMVLKGAFEDQTGRYAAGDFVQLGDGVEHEPMAGPTEACFCLIMIQNSPRYPTLIGKLAGPFLRI